TTLFRSFEALLGRQGHVEPIKEHDEAEEQDHAGDAVKDGRVSGDRELDSPKVEVYWSLAIHGFFSHFEPQEAGRCCWEVHWSGTHPTWSATAKTQALCP